MLLCTLLPHVRKPLPTNVGPALPGAGPYLKRDGMHPDPRGLRARPPTDVWSLRVPHSLACRNVPLQWLVERSKKRRHNSLLSPRLACCRRSQSVWCSLSVICDIWTSRLARFIFVFIGRLAEKPPTIGACQRFHTSPAPAAATMLARAVRAPAARLAPRWCRQMAVQKFPVPEMGDSISEGTVLELSKQVGDYVALDEESIWITTPRRG